MMHVARTIPFLALLSLLLGAVQLASASIYPTLPVQGTVWTAGQSVLVTWAEDGLPPAVNTMGPVTIEMWANANTFITTLAVNVDPKAGSVQVTVPALPSGGDQFIYILRFVSHVPMESMIYSADFKIVNNPSPPPTTVLPSSTARSVPVTSSTPPTSVTSTTTSISITPLTTSTSVVVSTEVNTPVVIVITSTSMVTPTLITLGSLPAPTVTAGSNATTTNSTASSSTPHPQRLGSGKNAAGRNLDMEKLMFRAMFIIWPALVGIVLTV